MRTLILLLLFSIYSYGQVIVSKSPQLTIQSKGLGTFAESVTDGTDSVSFTVNTRKITIDSVETAEGVTFDIYDSTLTYGQTFWAIFDYSKGTVGSFTKYLYVYHTGYGSPDTSTITYTIQASPTTIDAPTSLLAVNNASTGIGISWSDPNDVDTVIHTFNNFSNTNELNEWSAWQGATNEISIEAGELKVFDNNSVYSWLAATRKIDVNSSTTYRISVDGYIETGNSWWLAIRGTDDLIWYANLDNTVDGSESVLIEYPTSDSLQIWLQGYLDNGEYVLFDNFLVESTTTSADNVELYAQPFYNGISNGDFSLLVTQSATDTDYTHVVSDGLEYAYKARFEKNGSYSSYSNLDTAKFISSTPSYTPTYYVASSYGNDSNTGLDSANAWKTISKVNSTTFSPGDVIAFHRGDVFDTTPLVITNSGTSGSEIVFTAYGVGNKPIIGNYNKTYYAAIRISEYSRGGSIAGSEVDYIIIDNLKVIASKETNECEGISINGNNNVVQNCEIYGGTTGYIGSEKIGVRIHKSDANLDILDNEISYFRHGLHIYQPGEVLIEGNYIHHIYYSDGTANVGGNNIRFTADGDYPWDCEYNVMVKGNTLSYFDHTALWTGLVSNLVIEYNLIEESLDETIYRGGVKHGSIGKMFDDTNKLEGNSGVIFRYNVARNMNKYGQPGYTYDTDGTILSTNNGYPRPVYKNAAVDGSDFGVEPDHRPDALIGGGGYCEMWIHNNVFYNVDKKVFARGYSRADADGYGCSDGRSCGDAIAYNASKIAHFYNNTIYNVGSRIDITANGGLVNTEFDSQSPTYVKNNIFHHANTDANASNIEFQEEGDAVSNNLHVNKSGMGDNQDWGAVNTDSHAISVFFRTIDDSEELYSTDPLFNNPSSESLYLSNIGHDGATIPDFRVSEESSVISGGTAIGNDPSGRSVDDYDITGSTDGVADIGAFGSGAALTSAPELYTATATKLSNTSIKIDITYFDGNQTTSANVYLDTLQAVDSTYSLTISADSASATRTFSSLDSTKTYYWQAYVSNATGSDYSSWGSVNLSSALTEYTDTLIVDASNRDAYFPYTTYGTTILSASVVKFGRNSDSTIYSTGFSFPISSDIDVSAIIDTAYLVLKAASTTSGEADAHTYLSFEDVSTSATFTLYDAGYNNFVNRTRTDSLSWNVSDITSGTEYSSPDLSTILQDLITSQSGLTSGNYLGVLCDYKASTVGHDRQFYSYDNGSNYPKLIIRYRQ